jgi:hypothetical protein
MLAATRTLPRDPDADLVAAVNRVADDWDDTDTRLKARKEAALASLEYAKEHGTMSKREAIEQIEPDYPIDDQTANTWFRQNVCTVLHEAGEYIESEQVYRITADPE